MSTKVKAWWKEQVIYQIYPKSFKDSTGNGIGDLQGIISKLDYLKNLGVDIIWICPIYDSPNYDNGYDISNYYEIHEDYGTMQDFEILLQGLHERNMRLIMDIVVNHTSDEHEWFEKSAASKDNAFRDFYFWEKGKNGGPPNNWKSFFGGSAWQFDEKTQEYYLHLFAKKQPDLNWENPKVKDEICKILRFWLEKGIDGFRMDVIPLISKRLDFEETKLEAFHDVVNQVYSNGPKVHTYIKEMYERVLKDYDIMTVGEGPGINKDVGLLYVGHDRQELNMIFHLEHMFLGHGPKGRFDPIPYGWDDVKRIIEEWDDAMGDSGWISIFLDNHDFPRLVSRFGNDTIHRENSAKLLAMLVLTLRGTPCIYQGSEVGMTNVKFDNIEAYKDIETINFHEEFSEAGMTTEDFLPLVYENARDNARTPMQWDTSAHAGFSTGSPWMSLNPNYKEINVLENLKDEDSIYAFYKHLLNFRKYNKALVYGNFTVVQQESKNLYIYDRFDDDHLYRIVLNHSDNIEALSMSFEDFELQVANNKIIEDKVLKPWEARLYKKK